MGEQLHWENMTKEGPLIGPTLQKHFFGMSDEALQQDCNFPNPLFCNEHFFSINNAISKNYPPYYLVLFKLFNTILLDSVCLFQLSFQVFDISFQFPSRTHSVRLRFPLLFQLSLQFAQLKTNLSSYQAK